MLKRAKIIASSIVAPVTLFLGNKALAAISPGAGFVGESTANLRTFINTALNSVLGIATLIALIYIIMGGFNYLTSAGSPEKVQNATKMITYAVIGVVVIAISFAIKSYIFEVMLGLDITEVL